MKRLIYSGVRQDKDKFYVDYTYNYPEDIIDIVEPQLYTRIDGNAVYTFGYRFKDSVDSTTRTQFIHAVKQIGDNILSDDQLHQFISRPLAYLDQIVNLYDIDCMVYPLSQRSPLVSKIIKCINDITSRDMSRSSFEFVKTAPTDINFDFDSFESDHGNEQGYTQMFEYVNNMLLPKLHRLDYFSIARDVKAKYRPYITGFIGFNDPEDIEKFSKLQGQNILVVDDINTTGSTLNEILRILGKLNHDCNIFVYTLIGK